MPSSTWTSLQSALSQRLLGEVLSTGADDEAPWRVLILDEVTTSVISSAAKMSDLVAHGFSLVEDLNKGREPVPALPATYFIAPTKVPSAAILTHTWL